MLQDSRKAEEIAVGLPALEERRKDAAERFFLQPSAKSDSLRCRQRKLKRRGVRCLLLPFYPLSFLLKWHFYGAAPETAQENADCKRRLPEELS